MGVKIAFGTDAAPSSTARRQGIRSHGRIRHAADRCDSLGNRPRFRGAEDGTSARHDRTGQVRRRHSVEGNPLEDIGSLARVTFVMKAGQVYKSPRYARGPNGFVAVLRLFFQHVFLCLGLVRRPLTRQ